jgi:hypothetical protein
MKVAFKQNLHTGLTKKRQGFYPHYYTLDDLLQGLCTVGSRDRFGQVVRELDS